MGALIGSRYTTEVINPDFPWVIGVGFCLVPAQRSRWLSARIASGLVRQDRQDLLVNFAVAHHHTLGINKARLLGKV